MSTVHEFVTAHCPFEDVQAAAAAYVAGLPVSDGKATVGMQVHLDNLIVERRADIALRRARAYRGYEIMEIEIRPHGGGPYPVLKGTLTAEDDGPNYCRLELDGAYDPPLGVGAAVFDAVVGHSIAVAAIRHLLGEIKLAFEYAFLTGALVGS